MVNSKQREEPYQVLAPDARSRMKLYFGIGSDCMVVTSFRVVGWLNPTEAQPVLGAIIQLSTLSRRKGGDTELHVAGTTRSEVAAS